MELKNCPFCNAEAEAKGIDDFKNNGFWIECTACTGSIGYLGELGHLDELCGSFGSAEDAVNAWNTRYEQESK
jgi:hypothetical protein